MANLPSRVFLDQFEVLEPIGAGGMAEVWSGLHVGQNVPVAIKFVTGPWAEDPSYVETFRNEVRAVAGLNHPGVVMVFDHGEVSPEASLASGGLFRAGTPYIVMELASGGALDEVKLPLKWRDLKAVLLLLLDALAHAHARGVIHRDLKPANVLICTDQDVRPGIKLTDFGIAHAMQRTCDKAADEVTEGTPEYMAPEQCRAYWRDYGPWTDLYAFGCMAYEFATGDPPFLGNSAMFVVIQHLGEPVPRLPRNLVVPAGFEGWLRRLLQKEPADRFRFAADAAWALAQLPDPAGEEMRTDDHQLNLGGGVKRPIVAFRDTIALPNTMVGGMRPVAQEPTQPPDKDGPVVLCERHPPPLPGGWERPDDAGVSMKLVGTGLGLYGLRTIPLVDRHDERDAMWEALHHVGESGRPRLVMLHGGAGNGKTRLVQWMCERAHEVGGAWILRAFHSAAGGSADGIPRMVSQHLQCVGLARPQALERVEELLQAQGETDAYEWNALTELISPGTEHDWAEGARRILFASRTEVFALVVRMLRRLCRTRPCILWLDDVHWSADTLNFVKYVLTEDDEEPLPILMLGTARDETLVEAPQSLARVRELAQLEGSQEIAIGVLDPTDRPALVQELLGLEGELARQVEERTDGNPLFAVQLVGDWVQRGLLEVAERGFALKEGVEALLPDDLFQVWVARIDRLLGGNEEAEPQLQIAALLGREVVPKEWVNSCIEAGVATDVDLLGRLFRERLAASVDGGWTFTHGVLREALERRAHESGRAQDFHRAIVRMLNKEYPPYWPGLQERIGRHHYEAGDYEQALQPLLGAASDRRVGGQYRRGHELLALREDAFRHGGIEDSDPRWGEGWVLKSWICSNEGLIGEAWEWSHRAEVSAREFGWDTILPQALLGMGVAARDHGELRRATALTEEAYKRYETQKNRLGMALCMQGLGVISRYMGDLEWALTQVIRALNLHEKLRNPFGVAQSKLRLAEVLLRRSEPDEALKYARQAMVEFEAISAPLGVAWCHNACGDVHRLSTAVDLVTAEKHYEQALALFRRVASTSIDEARYNLAQVDLARNQFQKARASLERVREGYRKIERWGQLRQVAVALLACAAAERDWQAWDRWLPDTEGLRGEDAWIDIDVARAAHLAGDLARIGGEPGRALAVLEIELEQWQRLGNTATAKDTAACLQSVKQELGIE